MRRWLLYQLHRAETGLRRKVRREPRSLTARAARTLFSMSAQSLGRGGAAGMFWAMIPMPFQMAPALGVCIAARGNLPLAVALVWLSNPVTYLPIFYAQYRLGDFILQTLGFAHGEGVSFAGMDDLWDIFQTLNSGDVFRLYLGGVAAACALSPMGYALGLWLAGYVQRRRERKLARRRGRRQHSLSK